MKVLLSREDLANGVNRLAAEVRRDYGNEPFILLGVLTGSIMLVADLLRQLEGPVEVGMVWASSYRGAATRPSSLDIQLDPLPDLTGQRVLLVDDIFDTGRTLSALVDALKERCVASVHTLVLLRKPARAEVTMKPDYVGFDIPDAFVVGYGLDYGGVWRNLPEVCMLETDDFKNKPRSAKFSSSIESVSAPE